MVRVNKTEVKRPSELLVLARQLYARRTTGIVVPFKRLDPDHLGRRNCHNNADYWVMNHPGWKSVCGWLVFDHETIAQFNPHSVVENADGVRVDPTPSRGLRRYPFLQHEELEEDFIRIVKENWLHSIRYDVVNDNVSIRPWG
jgi:hypothetical protein